MLKVAHDRLTIEADLAEFARNRAGWEKKLSDAKKNQDAIEISKAEKKIQLYDSLINLAQKQKDINEGNSNGETEQDQSKKIWQNYYDDMRAMLEAEKILAEGNYEKLKKNIIDFYKLDLTKAELTNNQKYLLEVQKNKAIKDLDQKRIDEAERIEKEHADFMRNLYNDLTQSDKQIRDNAESQRKTDAQARIATKRIEADGDLHILMDVLEEEATMVRASDEYKNSSKAEQALIDAQFAQQSMDLSRQIADFELMMEEKKRQAKIETFNASAELLGNMSDLLGKNTLAGKSLAIAQATINTYLAASQALASAPNPIIGAIQMAAAIAMGLNQVKKIMSVKVSKTGGGGGAASGGSGQTLSSTFTAASPRVATSQAAASQSGAVGIAQQGDAQAAKAGNATAQALQNNPPVLYVDTFEAKQNEKNAVSVKANV